MRRPPEEIVIAAWMVGAVAAGGVFATAIHFIGLWLGY